MSESADITFQDTLNKWKLAPSKFAANYYKTKIEIGETYVREFKKSFDLKKIPGTGSLKESITYSLLEGSGLQIYTDETKFPVGRRKSGSKSYAAFHNAPDDTYPPNIQRQFIGDSPLIELKV